MRRSRGIAFAALLAFLAVSPAQGSSSAVSAYLAPVSACPASTSSRLAPDEQQRALLCLLNWARAREGQKPVAYSQSLGRAALAKGRDIVSCRELTHGPCGSNPLATARAAGYALQSWGENLYAGTGSAGTARAAFRAWLASSPHRANIFRPEWKDAGIALLRGVVVGHSRCMDLWVLDLGRR